MSKNNKRLVDRLLEEHTVTNDSKNKKNIMIKLPENKAIILTENSKYLGRSKQFLIVKALEDAGLLERIEKDE